MSKYASNKDTKNSSAPPLKGVNRALEVLELVASKPGRATDIANELGISWATLHRTLSQLEQGGFLERDSDSGRYNIGTKAWQIGTKYLANHRVLELAQPYLDSAAGKGSLTVQLVQRSGRIALTLYSRNISGEIITKATYGYHFPLHCGSKGQVLLAYSPREFIESYLDGPLESLTSESVVNPEKIRKIIEDIKSNGYAFTEGDVQPFSGSISAPVFDHQGSLVAAVCIITRRSAFKDQARKEEITEIVLQTTQSISIALGWRPSGILKK
tara:strand:+ start:4344 stop:5156 length:813 start_codon:yes stop_codon:yes gene_type:complete